MIMILKDTKAIWRSSMEAPIAAYLHIELIELGGVGKS